MSEQQPNELANSLEVAQINPIIKCMQHPDRILSGRHRAKEMNKKGKIARAVAFNCDTLAAQLGVSHEEAELWVQVNANIQRQVQEEERKLDALAAAISAQKQGVESGQIVKRVAKTLGIGERRAQQLLPSEFKRSYDGEGKANEAITGDSGSSVVHQSIESEGQQAPEQTRPLPQFSPDASQFRVSRHTAAAQLLETKFGYWGLHPEMDYANFPRYGEETKDGKTKSYTPDFWFPEHKLILEVEGEGSASKDDKRDSFFDEQGIHVLHIPDGMAKRYGNEICEILYWFLNPKPVK